ncbi:MAG TPA: hypothetical protein VJU86_08305 [Pyrinomonadaceae bacterium]|nr:hypothetical protein [Pyrinomonadaceae bacterium]
MRTTDCNNLRREIDGATPGRLRSAFANRHLNECPECKSFSEQTVKLQEILSGLGTVEAPGDFNFRLRARLAGEKPAGGYFSLSGFSFGYRSAAVAMLLLVFGAVAFLNLRPSSNDSLTANKIQPVAVNPAPQVPASTAAPAPAAPAVIPPDYTAEAARKTGTKSSALASHRANPRMGTRDMGSRPATVIKASDLNAQRSDFPIDSLSQPVRVSLDNGRGNSRTISLPPVSFGSQRVMSQGSPAYVATARGSW